MGWWSYCANRARLPRNNWWKPKRRYFGKPAVAAAEESDFTAQMLARAEVYRRLDRKDYADQCEGKIEDLEDAKEPPPD